MRNHPQDEGLKICDAAKPHKLTYGGLREPEPKFLCTRIEAQEDGTHLHGRHQAPRTAGHASVLVGKSSWILLFSSLKRCTSRYQPCFQIAPQGDYQLASHCNDRNLTNASSKLADASVKPLRQIAFWLMSQPQP